MAIFLSNHVQGFTEILRDLPFHGKLRRVHAPFFYVDKLNVTPTPELQEK
jgi:hypothetical protein